LLKAHRSDAARRRLGAFFDALRALDPTGASWLDRLVALPVGGTPAEGGGLGALEEHAWWPEERALGAPPALLEWVVRSLRCPSSIEACGPTPSVPEHLTVGPVVPDAYLSTADAVVVVHAADPSVGGAPDGAHASACRRILRDLDAAFGPAGPRALLGLVVVEPEGGREEVAQPWLQACATALAPDALAEALPHRLPDERAYIARCFVGVVTLRRARAALGVPEGAARASVPHGRDDLHEVPSGD